MRMEIDRKMIIGKLKESNTSYALKKWVSLSEKE
jgi:hypothetical protein